MVQKLYGSIPVLEDISKNLCLASTKLGTIRIYFVASDIAMSIVLFIDKNELHVYF